MIAYAAVHEVPTRRARRLATLPTSPSFRDFLIVCGVSAGGGVVWVLGSV